MTKLMQDSEGARLPSVFFSELKNGLKGVAVGEEHFFLAVERRAKDWRVRLADLHGGWNWLGGWTTVKDPEDLLTARKAKLIRDDLKRQGGELLLGQVIGVIQDHPEEWLPEEVEVDLKGARNRAGDQDPPGRKQPKALDQAEAEEVEAILNSPDPLEGVGRLLDDIIAGEEENKRVLFTLLLSGRLQDSGLKQIILLKGEAGSGKTTLMEIAGAFHTKTVGRFSPHALDYTDLKGCEVLRLKEVGSMDQENQKQGVSTLKFLSADDKGYTVEVTVRDEELGGFTTREYRIPPITLITSTIRVVLDPQFERRSWLINPDESKEQTNRIRDLRVREEREKAEVTLGLRGEISRDRSMRLLKALVGKLEACEVVVPFPEALFSIFEADALRVRGDYTKVLSLVKLYGFLMQKSLSFPLPNGRRVVFVTPEVALRILQWAKGPLTSMFMELDERTRRLLDVLKELGLSGEGQAIGVEDRGKIALKLSRSERTVKRYLSELETAGYASSTGGHGREKVYTLLQDLDSICQKEAGILDIADAGGSLALKMREEARSFLSGLLDKFGSGYPDIFSVLNQFKTYLSTPGTICPTPEPAPKQAPPGETGPENNRHDQCPDMPASLRQGRPTEGEMLSLLRGKWQHGIQNDFEDLIVKLGGHSLEEARQLRERWVDEGLMGYDPDGLLAWAKGR